jgi:APA family basic amino acid/polyamine antiporter
MRALARDLGLAAGVAVILAQVIGTGVFVKARVMTCNVGEPGLVLAAWLAGGLLTLAGAITYAELGAMLPRAGGEMLFLRSAYGRAVAFLYGWMQMLVGKSGSQAALAVAFAIFAGDLMGGPLSAFAASGVALGAIAAGTAINFATVRSNGGVAIALTTVKVGLIAAAALAALLVAVGSAPASASAASAAAGACVDVPASARGGFPGFGAAVIGALWGYSGWGNLTLLGDELREPGRNLPRALLLGIGAIVALYLIANAAYFVVLTPAEVAAVAPGSSVAREAMVRAFGALAAAGMAAGLLASSFGSLHVSMLTGARIPYALAHESLLPRAFGDVSARGVPWVAVLVQGGWACALALSGSFDELTDYTVFGSLAFQALGVSAVFVLRRSQPDAPRPYRAWGYPLVPALFVAATSWLVASTLLATPGRALAGLALIALGLPVYALLARRAGAAAAQG